MSAMFLPLFSVPPRNGFIKRCRSFQVVYVCWLYEKTRNERQHPTRGNSLTAPVRALTHKPRTGNCRARQGRLGPGNSPGQPVRGVSSRELTGAASQGQNTVIWCCSFIVVPYPWRAHVGCSSGPTPELHDSSSTVFKKLLIHNTSIRTVGSKLCLAINRAMWYLCLCSSL